MKKTGIVFLAFVMFFGGRPPVVLAQEQRPDIDENDAETISEVKEEASSAAAEEIDVLNDDSSDEETINADAEEQDEIEQDLEDNDAVVTITTIGEGEVEQKYYVYSMAAEFAYRFTPRPAEGYHTESIKAYDEKGNDIIQFDGGSYIDVIDRYDHINVEVLFVNDKNFAPRQFGEKDSVPEAYAAGIGGGYGGNGGSLVVKKGCKLAAWGNEAVGKGKGGASSGSLDVPEPGIDITWYTWTAHAAMFDQNGELFPKYQELKRDYPRMNCYCERYIDTATRD